MIPLAVSASETAINSMVRFPVWTLGSRMMLEAVGDGLDPRIGAAAERVRPHEEREHPGEAETEGRRAQPLSEADVNLPQHRGDFVTATRHRAENQDGVRRSEEHTSELQSQSNL